MKPILSYLKCRSKITIFATLMVLSALIFIISHPKPLQIYNTYIQQLSSANNAKMLSADEIHKLNLKFNLMDLSGKSVFSMMSNAMTNDECTLDNMIQKKMQQDHPCVVDYIRKNYLKKPPPPGTPLKLGIQDTTKASQGQADIALGLLKHKKNGFFVDCGANDGENLSNTLHMEVAYGWTGILIEASPSIYKKLEARNRNAHLVPLCLSLEPFVTNVTFRKTVGDLLGFIEGPKTNSIAEMEKLLAMTCFPFYSVLLAVGRVDVDFFSLDIEGHELAVIKTIPFHKANIQTFVVEYANIPEGLPGLDDYMEKSGYFRSTTFGIDAIYKKDCTN